MTNTQQDHTLSSIRIIQQKNWQIPGDRPKVEILIDGRLVLKFSDRDNVDSIIQVPPGQHDLIIQRSFWLSGGLDVIRYNVVLAPGAEGIIKGVEADCVEGGRDAKTKHYYYVTLENFSKVNKIQEKHEDD